MTDTEPVEQPPVLHLFSAPLLTFVWQDVEDLNRELGRVIADRRALEPSVRQSNAGGWQSPKDLQTWTDAAIRDLLVKIDVAIYTLSSDCFGEEPLLSSPKWRISAWANVNRAGDYNLPHCHSGGVWSGVYYVDPGYDEPPEDLSGAISFLSPTMASLAIDNLRPPSFVRSYFEQEVAIVPKSGQIMLFPSWLRHYVHPHRGARDRISVSWDVHFDS